MRKRKAIRVGVAQAHPRHLDMTRLQSEWQRLYLPRLPAAESADEHTSLISPDGQVRAVVLALGRPADWAAVSALWQAVQADLALPAPAIAVSGVDSYQLWFSLAEALPAAQAHDFLDLLRARYLSHLAADRLSLLPGPDATASPPAQHAPRVPAQQAGQDQWSAFVAPDLAPMFAETPWLDIPPSPDGQADLLAGLQSITQSAWQAALVRLRPAQPSSTPSVASGSDVDPRRFLIKVMNDEAQPMALRIEAAKALLPDRRD